MSETVEQATAALAAAKDAYLSELERDAQRWEGSGAQERRREERQQSLLDAVARCERNLDTARLRSAEDASGHRPYAE